MHGSQLKAHQPIDRHALVKRHNVVLSGVDFSSPLSVGNGQFCFTADITGLQTFEAQHNPPPAMPLSTMADWGWHHKPNPHGSTRDVGGVLEHGRGDRPV